MTGRVWLAAAFGLLCGLSGAGPSDKRYSFNSPGGRYRVTADIDRELAGEIARHMERIFAEYDRRLAAFHTRDSRAFPLYLFARYKDYVEFMKARSIEADNTSGMFFWSSDDERGLAAWTQGQSRTRLLKVLQHEGFHQFAAVRIGPDLPTWVNEGLAEYFGEAIAVKDRFVTGVVDGDRLRNLNDAIKEDKAFRFEKLLNMSSDTWNQRVRTADGAALMYDQSWSIVHFLVHADGGKYVKRFEKFLLQVSRGERPADAFERAFETRDFDAFERSWRRYVAGLEPDPLSTGGRRLEFLGAGLKELRKRGVEVSTVGELRDKLREIGFKALVASHGRLSTLSAAQDELFEPPPSGDARKPSRLVLTPDKTGKLPPEVRIEGLKVGVRLTWKAEEDGEPTADVVYE